MDRQRLGIIGSDCCGEFRVELAAVESEGPLRLELLHEEGVPTFAHVFRGRMNCSGFHVAVAVKLQRDQPLTKEQSQCVSAKFDIERDNFRELQKGPAPDEAGDGHVVRLFETSPSSREDAAGAIAGEEGLPPSIVCRHALHALHPRCPEPGCGGLLKTDEWAASDADRRLVCTNAACNRSHANTGDTGQRIVAATVQKDPACRRCPHRTSADSAVCLASSHFLNFHPARLLLFELLDVDLEDYLLWKRLDAAPAGRARPWQRFRQYRRERDSQLPAADSPLGRLREVLDLFGQALASVEALHAHAIAHRDLKPHNLCLRFGGEGVRLKVIDLGLADSPKTLLYLRQAQGSRQLQTEYAAPEVQEPQWSFPIVPYRTDRKRVVLSLSPAPLNAADLLDPLVVAGDLLHLKDEGDASGFQAATVEQTAIQGGVLRIWANFRAGPPSRLRPPPAGGEPGPGGRAAP